MALADIRSLSTEDINVARLAAAHNAAVQILDARAADKGGSDALADQYVAVFQKIYAAMGKSVATS